MVRGAARGDCESCATEAGVAHESARDGGDGEEGLRAYRDAGSDSLRGGLRGESNRERLGDIERLLGLVRGGGGGGPGGGGCAVVGRRPRCASRSDTTSKVWLALRGRPCIEAPVCRCRSGPVRGPVWAGRFTGRLLSSRMARLPALKRGTSSPFESPTLRRVRARGVVPSSLALYRFAGEGDVRGSRVANRERRGGRPRRRAVAHRIGHCPAGAGGVHPHIICGTTTRSFWIAT